MIWGSAFPQLAQTGINTNTPAQTLHVSGTPASTEVGGTGATGKFVVSPTIRVNGLARPANPVHPATGTSVQPLYVTKDGDLVTKNDDVQIVVPYLPNQDNVASAAVLNVTGTSVASISLKQVPFVLAKPSIVYISANIEYGSIQLPPALAAGVTVDAAHLILDKKAKMVGIQFRFSAVQAGSGIPTGIFASSTNSFTNGSNTGNMPTGFYYFSLGKEIKLPAGSYTFEVWGYAAGNGNNFSLYFGTSPTDALSIIAIPL